MKYAHKLLVVFGTAMAAMTAPTGTAQTADPLDSMRWLSGCWRQDGKEAGSGEHWMPPAGGTMLGVGRTVRNGKTAEFEFMQLRVGADGKLAFIALPMGKSETSFALRSDVGGEAIFENSAHDFPQRVIYRRVDATHLFARIEGTRNGAVRGIDFPMTRVPCEGHTPGASG